MAQDMNTCSQHAWKQGPNKTWYMTDTWTSDRHTYVLTDPWMSYRNQYECGSPM